jgi:hypothetical protein
MANLPPLEADVIVNDLSSVAVERMVSSGERLNRQLQTLEHQTATSTLDDQFGMLQDRARAAQQSTGLDASSIIDTEAFAEATREVEELSDSVDRLQTNLLMLGESDLGDTPQQIQAAREYADRFATSLRQVSNNAEDASVSGGQLVSILAELSGIDLTGGAFSRRQIDAAHEMVAIAPRIGAGLCAMCCWH